MATDSLLSRLPNLGVNNFTTLPLLFICLAAILLECLEAVTRFSPVVLDSMQR